MKKPAACALVSLALGTAVAAWRALDTASPEVPTASAAGPARVAQDTVRAPRPRATGGFGWEPGHAYTYRLRYDASQSATLVGGSHAGTLALDGDLRVAVHRRLADGALATEWSLESLRAAAARFDGAAVADGAALAGSVQVVLEATGDARTLRFKADTPAPVRVALQTLVLEVAMHLPADLHLWQAVDSGILGRAQGRYTRSADGREVVRRRGDVVDVRALSSTAAHRLEASAAGTQRATFAPGGALQALSGDEALDARVDDRTFTASRRLELSLAAIGDAGAPGAGYLAEVPAATLAPDEAARHRAMLARTEGLTGDGLVAAVLGGPVDQRLAWRATGLLRVQPALCDTLATTILDAPDAARRLGLDLLASTGTPDAEAALVRVLRETAPSPEDVSRLGLLRRPGVEAVALATELASDEDPAIRRTAELALGAQAAFSDDPELAEGLAERLDHAGDPLDRANTLAALGNAVSAAPALAERILSYTSDPSDGVRRAAAEALRKVDTDAADHALLGLLEDPAPTVRAAALTALGAAPRTDAVYDAVASMAERGAFEGRMGYAVLQLVAREPVDEVLAGRVARTLLSDADPGVRALAQEVLQVVAARAG